MTLHSVQRELAGFIRVDYERQSLNSSACLMFHGDCGNYWFKPAVARRLIALL
jgi:hypothetical protein